MAQAIDSEASALRAAMRGTLPEPGEPEYDEAVADDETACAGEQRPGWYVFPIAMCPAPEMLPGEREWVRDIGDALGPHVLKRTYVATVDEDASNMRAVYGAAKYDRLARIKRAYDPDNVFHRNANIKPAAAEPTPAGVA